MAYLKEDEWIVLNEIGYNISFIYDFCEMRKMLFNWLHMLIDFDGAVFSLIDINQASIRICQTSGYKIPERYIHVWEKEMPRFTLEQFFVYGINSSTNTVSAIHTKEKMSDATIYRNFYDPLKFTCSLSTCFYFKNEPLGYFQLFKKGGKALFDKRDVFIIEQLYKYIAYRLNYERKKSKTRFYTEKNDLEKLRLKYQFTSRELELFDYAVKGMTNTEIANSMNISINTVKKHFHNIYEKMHISGRIELLQSLSPSYGKVNSDE